MAKGEYKIDGLTSDEHRAALAAVKLVRGEAVKNAYLEGHTDGWRECAKRYRGEYTEGSLDSWDKSQAKALSQIEAQTPYIEKGGR